MYNTVLKICFHLFIGRAKYKCETCGKRFHWEFELKTHLNSFVRNKEVKCECDVTFPCNGDLMKHLKCVHRYKLSFNCDICGKLFTKHHDLQHHLRSHTGEKPYPCSQCDRSFSYRGDLNKHLRSHTGEKPFACEHCQQRFTRKDYLVNHTYKHTGEMSFNCVDCGRGFATKWNLTQHLKSELHNLTVYGERNKPYPCEQSTETFLYKKQLNQHKHTHHSLKTSELQGNSQDTAAPSSSVDTADPDVIHTGGNTATAASLSPETAKDVVHTDCRVTTVPGSATIPREFLCKYCNGKFTDLTVLTQHLREHTDKRHYFCKYCYKIFAHNFTLSQHILKHTGERPHVCEECNKGFKTKVELVRHTTVHTGERKYKCKQCGKAFKRPVHLKRHLETHSNIRRFKCDHCNKAFKTKDKLNRYILRNMVEYNLKCELCDREFSSRHGLKVHVRRHHSSKESAETTGALAKPT